MNGLYDLLEFLVYIATVSPNDQMSFSDILFFQLILLHTDDGSLKLMKYTPFNSIACRRIRFTEINRFNKKTLKWNKSISMTNEIRDFYGCELVVVVPNYYAPYTYLEVEKDGSFTSSGSIVDFFKTLGTFYNFSLTFNLKDSFTGELLFPHLVADFYGIVNNFKVNSSGYILTRTFIAYEYGFVIPHGDLFTPLEKLALPFDLDTWICCLMFFAFGMIAILIVNYTSANLQKFLFGQNVSTPTLNLFRAFFGISLHIVPRRNFARYILMTFILYCLIIRTAYQGKMFEFIKLNVRKPEVKSIEEMVEQNFTFYSFKNLVEWYRNFDIFQGLVFRLHWHFEGFQSLILIHRARLVALESKEFFSDKIYEETSRSGSKQTILICLQDLSPLINSIQTERAFKIIEASSFTTQCGLETSKNNFLNRQVNKKIVQVVESGLMDYWTAKYVPRPKYFPQPGPQILTMDHLSIGFEIWLCCLLLCFVTFLIEQMRSKFVVRCLLKRE